MVLLAQFGFSVSVAAGARSTGWASASERMTPVEVGTKTSLPAGPPTARWMTLIESSNGWLTYRMIAGV